MLLPHIFEGADKVAGRLPVACGPRGVLLAGWVGGDPLAERRRLRRAGTVAELAHLYLEGHAKLHKRTW